VSGERSEFRNLIEVTQVKEEKFGGVRKWRRKVRIGRNTIDK